MVIQWATATHMDIIIMVILGTQDMGIPIRIKPIIQKTEIIEFIFSSQLNGQ